MPNPRDVPAHLRFFQEQEEGEEWPPIVFSVGAKTKDGDAEEVFEARGEMPFSHVAEHEVAISAQGVMAVREVVAYFERCMEPEEYARFRAFVDSPDHMIRGTTLATVMESLHLEYVRRPTKRPSSSPDGSGTTGDTSTDTSPAEDSTSEPSPSPASST